ncbi:Thioredoxin [Planctomycetales bacterium 10988]|nr:Thioredoxin [Planctomycetales bacterium 10988]
MQIRTGSMVVGTLLAGLLVMGTLGCFNPNDAFQALDSVSGNERSPEVAKKIGAPVKLTADNFQQEVVNADQVVLIDFYADWCGPCRSMEPIVSDLASDYKGKLIVGKVDVDKEQALSQRMGIQGLPTFLLVKNGKVVKKFVGSRPRSELEAQIKKHL